MDDRRPRLMLFTPKVVDAAAFAAPLGEALSAGDVAAVVLDLADADERSLVNAVKRLAPIAQGRDAALLIADRPQIMARGGADGLHLSQPAGLDAAFDLLKDQDRIVGAGGLRLRDDAMAAAEAGVDYVMFGDARPDGSFPPLASVIERAAWWAGIFETPCVAFAPELDAIDELALTGAEFVALGEPVWTEAQGPAAIVRSALQRLASRTHV
ncbi:thiamine-phosphate pyrophosphorylase [Rhizobiales bacterium GAS188]|nr:thiamine-phosphate pyrophosphorylase [Rhizobiales bacterium GAS188]